MTSIRRTAAILALAGACALPAVATAGNEGSGQGAGGAKSKIVIRSLSATGASGKVTSGKSKCEHKRKVTLFRLDDFISVKVSILRSDGQGNWRSKKDLQPGEYFAKVDSIPGCRYDVSRTKRL
jgi:hypothetical protein